jgi:hypothetical protein
MTFASILTRSVNNARASANTAENILTPTAVAARGVKQIGVLPVPDDPRVEAQVLIAAGVLCRDGLTHDLAIVCSMGNTVYAYDATTLQLIWAQRIGNPINGSAAIDGWQINVKWGILSTPVIDLKRGVLYVCCWSSPDGSTAKARFHLHALSLTDGALFAVPVDLSTITYTPPGGSPIPFAATARKQRASLLLLKPGGDVVVAFGSVSESLASARGWLMAFDGDTLQTTATWTSTAKHAGAGIWQGGEGPASDSAGNIYVVTGNGGFEPPTDFGESFVKLAYTRPSSSGAGTLKPTSWWSPFSDSGRDGEPQDQPQITVSAADLADAPSNMNDWTDQDLGSAGPLLIEELGLLLGAGKDGILYTMNTAALGDTANADFVDPAVNYAKLASQPIWFTFFPGWNVLPAPAKFADLNQNYFQRTHHLHGTAAHYLSTVHGHMLFCMGENSPVRAWTVNEDKSLTFLADSDEIASPGAPIPPGGMPGGMLTLSAQQGVGDSAVLWALVPWGDANKQVTPGMLYAYDAERFLTRPDGSKQLRLLWRSDQWNWDFKHPKFNQVTVSGGRVFVPTYDGRVLVLALA